jgi:predicted Zn-dependent protease
MMQLQRSTSTGNATGTYNNQNFESHISMTAVDSGGDWQIEQMGVAEYMRLNRATIAPANLGSDTVGGENHFGDSKMMVPPGAFQAVHNPGDWAHEFGHALGLTHAPDLSGSIMSYDKTRTVMGQDLFNLARGYR